MSYAHTRTLNIHMYSHAWMRTTSWFLFSIFCLLYMIDGWLSIQFMQHDITLEANPIVKYLTITSGTPYILYFLKSLMLSIVALIYARLEKAYPGKTIILTLILLAGMSYINLLSFKLIAEICKQPCIECPVFIIQDNTSECVLHTHS